MIPLSKIIKKASYLTSKEAALVEKAYDFAKKCHLGQERKSGEAYLNHPIRVVLILSEYVADAETICAALLHDVLEDCEVTLKNIKELFGDDVANLVAGVTKFNEEHFRGNNHLERKIETLRKLFTVMEKDIRVIIIKLCDRLDNMKTLNALSEEKQLAFAKETLNVYVKIADRLCMQRMRNELEVLCTYYLDRDLYTKYLVAKKNCLANKKLMQLIIDSLREKDREKIIKKIRFLPMEICDFKGEIYDKNDYFCTITTKSTEDCYKTVFYIHSLWESIRTSFNDFINRPKINGHRAIYSKVLTNTEVKINFRINTQEWETYYVNGITTYCFSRKDKKRLDWMKKLEDINNQTKGHSNLYWKGLQNDILKNTILVYGNNDEGVILPENATALDAAFYMYKEKTLFLEKILINNKPVPLFYKLSNNDVINCTFNKKETAHYQWLDYIETIIAKGFIQDFLHKKEKEKKIKIGKELLQNEFLKHEKGFINEISDTEIERVLSLSTTSSLEKLYSSIGEGRITPEEAFIYFFPSEKKKKKKSSHKILVKLHKDAMLDVIALFPNTPDTGVRFSDCNKKGITQLMANVFLHSDLELEDLIKGIQRVNGVESVENENITEKRKANIFTAVLLTLWGLDPIFAHMLLNTGIPPLSFAALRFITIAILLGAVILVSLKKIKLQSKLSTMRWSFLLAIGFLIATSCTTYFSLANTLPSNYLIIVLMSIVIAHLIGLFKTKKRDSMSKMVANIIGVIIIIVLFIIFSKASISIQLITLSVPLFFIGYTLSIEQYRKTEEIEARSITALFLIHLVGSVLFLPILFVIQWHEIQVYQYILMISFFAIFSVIPYVLFAKKTREISHPLLIICFSIVVAVQIMIESSFMPEYTSILKLAALLLVTSLIVINNYSKKKGSIKFISQNILRR
jgi:GTP pyrophosphokinase